MRIVILIILASFPLMGIAQIEMQLSIDKKEKEMTLVLINKSNETFKLSPQSIDQYEQGSGCIYSFCFKNREGEIIYERSRFIYDELPSTLFRAGQFLLPLKNNEYKYDFKKWYDGEFHSIEVKIQLKAINYKTKKTFFREIKKNILFE